MNRLFKKFAWDVILGWNLKWKEVRNWVTEMLLDLPILYMVVRSCSFNRSIQSTETRSEDPENWMWLKKKKRLKRWTISSQWLKTTQPWGIPLVKPYQVIISSKEEWKKNKLSVLPINDVKGINMVSIRIDVRRYRYLSNGIEKTIVIVLAYKCPYFHSLGWKFYGLQKNYSSFSKSFKIYP